ncbi:uncharacterized protein LOC123671507 [Harmonia axyridis]|uniref:uncharacterized protein LOC123671507 n=1 Tax=Harmonia axyridis TaxID=115357 RepID=UPI001E278510|nr:uncharacterized protein LOC123671507 [Harmonia axyridis]
MSFLKFFFIRRLIRRHSRPIVENKAELWQKRLAIGYMVVAWNALGFVAYQMLQGKTDWAEFHGLKSKAELKMTQAQNCSQALGIRKAEVFKVSGLQISKYEIDSEETENSNS